MNSEQNNLQTNIYLKENKPTLVVIGGGAAGFFCAVNAARMNTTLRVIIVEKSNKLLSKVKISGGGRCNMTHACFEIEELVKCYPRGEKFLKKAFYQFNTKHTIEWFEERGVKLKTEADGRIFPITNNSQTIIDCLLREAKKYNVEILLHHEVKEIEIRNSENEWLNRKQQFKICFSNSEFIFSDFVCISCGGYPRSSQFYWLTKLGHTIEYPVPSLFTFNIPYHPVTQLMGLSIKQAIIKITGSKLVEEGAVLITHWGLSGPAILRLSAWGAKELAQKQYEFSAQVNWLKDYNEQSLRKVWSDLRNQYASKKICNENPFELPKRLWLLFLRLSDIDLEMRWADLSSKQQNKLIQNLTAQIFEVKGKTTYKEEFVTSGGINLSEIDANTMQSKIISNIFFAGEILNVDGITGGFNFQNAWTTGWIAALAIKNINLNLNS